MNTPTVQNDTGDKTPSRAASTAPIKVKIFGANLRDQSKGAFVVHAADCADCKKLEALRENCYIEEHDSALSISRSIWADMINEGSMSAEDGLQEIHFSPCVKFRPTGGPAQGPGTETLAEAMAYARAQLSLGTKNADFETTMSALESLVAAVADRTTPGNRLLLEMCERTHAEIEGVVQMLTSGDSFNPEELGESLAGFAVEIKKLILKVKSHDGKGGE